MPGTTIPDSKKTTGAGELEGKEEIVQSETVVSSRISMLPDVRLKNKIKKEREKSSIFLKFSRF